MKNFNALIAYLCILCTVSLCSAKRGFILTAPKAIDAGSTEYLTFTAFDVPSGGQVTIKLLHWYSGDMLAEKKVTVLNNINMWVEIVVPPSSSDVKAKLQLKGTFSDGYKIEAEKEVHIRGSSIVTFVQTDKPIYKPGQTVKFRVLPLDSQLKPLDTSTVADVWIEDPSGIRVAQWKQIKYTYGKKVDGTFKIKVTYKRNPWERKRAAIPSVKHSGLISGCETINIHTLDLLMQTHEFGYRPIEIFAKVKENGTGIHANASTTVEITHSALTLSFLGLEGNNDYFKPGLPYFGELSVTKPDGEPATSEKVEICAFYKKEIENYRGTTPASKKCHLFTSNKKGRIHFSVAPLKSSAILQITLRATATNYDEVGYHDLYWRQKIVKPTASLDLKAWYSPSDSYLQIQPLSQEMECEKRQGVKIRYTAEKGDSIKFYHQVLSRGRIVQQGSHQRAFYSKEEDPARYDLERPTASPHRRYTSTPTTSTNDTKKEPEVGEFLLSFDPRATMAPLARLLVFYVREDGEIVADSRMFRISRCLLNKVNLHFRHEQQYPSTEATMLLSASPASVCGIGLVDKSVRFLRQEGQFKKENIFKIMEKYDVGKEAQPRQVTEDYCYQKTSVEGLRRKRFPVRRWRKSAFSVDDEIWDDEDYDPEPIRPNADRYFNPLYRYFSHHVDTSMAFEEAGMVVMSNFELENRPCIGSIPMAVPYSSDYIPRRSHGRRKVNFRGRVVNAFPAQPAPLPQVEVKKEVEPPKKVQEVEEIRSYFPETWLWEMHKIGANGQTVLKRQLPHTITQWVGGAVCVHPKTGLGLWEDSSVTAFQPFFVSFNLPYSVVRGEVLPLTVSVFNYLSECLPIKLSLEPSDEYNILSESRWHRMCVCGSESKSHRFSLEPTALGRINITVYGFSLEDDDEAVCGNEVTARLSARDAVSKQLLVEAEGFPKEDVFNYFVCPKNTNGTYSTEVDLLLPENVVEGSGRAFVSVTGDLMGPALNGLGNLVKLPVGCGEQNMVLFVPNIFVLDYLTSTNRITEKIKSDCLSNMKIGYQRELNYRHKDGSYSAFGSSDSEGSLWLTAFVVKSFGQARRFIDIDEKDLALSTSWLLEKQFENGCFEPTGRVLHKEMKGGLSEGEQSLAPLTAYVLVSLLESTTQKPEQPAIRNGLKCLEADENPNAYALALYAYSSVLANEKRLANRYLQQLESRAIARGGYLYWDGDSKSVSVEPAGYYILSRTLLEGKNSVGSILPVIRWIAQQRNSHGGFVSTQDTVVALQALAHYSSLMSTTPIDIGLVIESDELVKGFKVDSENKLVTQSAQIPVLPAVVDLQAVGDGCALVQFSLRYNVQKVSDGEFFDMDINVGRLGSSNCNTPKIDICMRYKFPDQITNMVVLTNDQKCFRVFIKSETEVEEIKPASIKLYDYYQPEIEITKEYIVPTNCTLTALPTPQPDVEASTTVSSFQTANTGSEGFTIVSTDPGLEMTEVKPVSTEPPPEYDTTILNEGVRTSKTIEESLSTETIIGTEAPTNDKDLLISGTAETLAAIDSTEESTTT
ncbi:pregnancy zone protein [Trichonephila inaurata madagascariensis]|uniref:Pregnancy zone protein n=2 Tax=Trichonephila inaurata madagascariensis TaxID=2747483 RepID=A0A8X6WUU2_9ARAC|nr:pregnancy zone protein [Trichonephila inaurata madagascariensis]